MCPLSTVCRIVAGMEGKPLTDGKAKSLVAYHEVGHAVCGTLTPGHDPVQKVTLIPRGQARGLTWFIPGKDSSGWVKLTTLRQKWGVAQCLSGQI
jgi:cell division protease FtsH